MSSFLDLDDMSSDDDTADESVLSVQRGHQPLNDRTPQYLEAPSPETRQEPMEKALSARRLRYRRNAGIRN